MIENTSKVLIELRNVSKIYEIGPDKIEALKDVSFTIDTGEFVVILGPSGSGKTTLLNVLGGMDQLTMGQFFFAGKEINQLTQKEMVLYRRHEVGFVFQFYNLMPNLTAIENVELATEICDDAYEPLDIIKRIGLENRKSNFPSQLSGGEQQRVSIARALAKNPHLILCDEPTGALDYKTGKHILSLIHEMAKKENKTIVLVTHNSALKDMADKVIYIRNGEIQRVTQNSFPKPIMEITW